MIFTSVSFLIFFAITLVIHFLLPHRVRWIFLLAASLYFYGHQRIENLAFLLLPTLAVYFAARMLEKSRDPRARRWLLSTGTLAGISVLFVFKYINFAAGSLFALASLFSDSARYSPLRIVYVVGISFYTFKLLSYLLDVYHGRMKAERHLGYFTLYVSFFPQLLAGPIDRAGLFIRQLKTPSTFDVDRVISGFQQVLWGLFKKMVIADRLAIFVNQVFTNPDDQGLNLLFGVYFYAFQIYCDFSGYSDMAIGISRILGYRSMLNFDFPYHSRTFTEFWNRWHISLSTWLRDYLFLPIAYATMRRIKGSHWLGIKAEAWGYCIAIFITMFLGGLWHGAAWTFVAWGTLHGIYLVAGYVTRKFRKRLARRIRLNRLPHLRHALQIFTVFHFTAFAWIFFRSPSFSHAFHYIASISLTPAESGNGHVAFILILLMVFILMETIYRYRTRIVWIKEMPPLLKTALTAAWICLMIILAVDTTNEFIYFQF